MENLWAINAKAKAKNEARDKDAARYRWLRERTGATNSNRFSLPSITGLPAVNLMRGSVAQHLDEAIDAAMLVTANGEVRGASRLAGEASSAEGATSTVGLGAVSPAPTSERNEK